MTMCSLSTCFNKELFTHSNDKMTTVLRPEYNPQESPGILNRLAKPGNKLDDIAIMNILYLLCELRSPRGLHIFDSVFVESAPRRERSMTHLQNSINTQSSPHHIILLPLFKHHHWSLLAFLPALGAYVHFDSCHEVNHASYVSSLVALMDKERHYHPLTVSHSFAQQASDWECGYFILMAAYMLIDMQPIELSSESTLRFYMTRKVPSITLQNVVPFSRLLSRIIVDL